MVVINRQASRPDKHFSLCYANNKCTAMYLSETNKMSACDTLT